MKIRKTVSLQLSKYGTSYLQTSRKPVIQLNKILSEFGILM
jgi:hypothetical protein